MCTKAIASLGFASAMLVSSTSWASGFYTSEVSARGVGQGGATVADGSEPAVQYINPAGIARLDSLQIHIGASAYANKNTFTAAGTTNKETAKIGFFPIPNLFASYKALPWLTAGVGTYMTYGLGITWPDRWSGYNLVKKAELQSYTFQPTLALGPVKGLSIGVGVSFLVGSVELSRGLPLGDNQSGFTRISGKASTISANFGILYEATQWLRLGASYRMGPTAKIDNGRVEFQVPAAYDQFFSNQRVRTEMNLPAVATIGARFLPTRDLRFELDFNWLGWSTYEKLQFNFDNPDLNNTMVKNYKNSILVRFGAEYDIKDFTARVGMIYDQTPVPNSTLDPLLPDQTRIDWCVGAGYSFGKLRMDVAYMVDFLAPRRVTAAENAFPGTYDGTIHTASIGAHYKF